MKLVFVLESGDNSLIVPLSTGMAKAAISESAILVFRMNISLVSNTHNVSLHPRVFQTPGESDCYILTNYLQTLSRFDIHQHCMFH